MIYFLRISLGQRTLKISSLKPTLTYSNYFLYSPGTSNKRESTVYILWKRGCFNSHTHVISLNKPMSFSLLNSPTIFTIIQSRYSELFNIRFRLPGSLSPWLAARCGYEILAFEKPCLHYKISIESRLIYTGSKWKRTNRMHWIFSRKVRTCRLGLN